ncbi:hypothetical protein HNY73_019083 [Argiope bruennichi]|uniref:Uncharacterized protein n=1 Tax=Argiope bruennichi TaxID=94029 RepID=A0A8T0EGG8_ARGBR|nr:hypothetical protein HNY73_019083 [Argiope bruennichi]
MCGLVRSGVPQRGGGGVGEGAGSGPLLVGVLVRVGTYSGRGSNNSAGALASSVLRFSAASKGVRAVSGGYPVSGGGCGLYCCRVFCVRRASVVGLGPEWMLVLCLVVWSPCGARIRTGRAGRV